MTVRGPRLTPAQRRAILGARQDPPSAYWWLPPGTSTRVKWHLQGKGLATFQGDRLWYLTNYGTQVMDNLLLDR